MKITLNTKRYELKEGTKTVYLLEEETTENITQEQAHNIVDACRFFRNLGGSETLQKNYTKYGYLPSRLISKSPDRKTKVERTFSYE